jgi:DNA-binding winged helix-turn-helix (wHTH) protein
MQPDQQVTFDGYRLDRANAQLWRGKQAIALTNQTFAVLRYLVEHAGQVVTKVELFEQLWQGTVVSDRALAYCVVELRKALGDNAKQPKFIETVYRRGYRFIAPLSASPPVSGFRFQVYWPR